MLDLETLGVKVNSAFISIGAIFFDPSTGKHGKEFHIFIELQSCLDSGLEVDADTIEWWMQQDEKARQVFSEKSRAPLKTALKSFSKFVNSHKNMKKVKVWGNGASFDNAILANAYKKTGLPIPWEFRNDRDVRTIVALGRSVGIDPKKDLPFQGVKHNALADARHQASYVSLIWQRLVKK